MVYDRGKVRCWGLNEGNAVLGLGSDGPSDGGIALGGPTRVVAAGNAFTCALSTAGEVRCWGLGDLGALGRGNEAPVGDNETPLGAGTVSLGEKTRSLVAGGYGACGLLTSGKVRCWGVVPPHFDTIGDDERPSEVAPVTFPGPVAALSMEGVQRVCALLKSGEVWCYPTLADDDSDDGIKTWPARVDLAGPARSIEGGAEHSCAVLVDGRVQCWGSNEFGQLGGHTPPASDGTTLRAVSVRLDGPARSVSAGESMSCALLKDGRIECWGSNKGGQLGLGRGTSEQAAGIVPLDEKAVDVIAGYGGACALLIGGRAKCWGDDRTGELGSVATAPIGDDEPASAAPVMRPGRWPRREQLNRARLAKVAADWDIVWNAIPEDSFTDLGAHRRDKIPFVFARFPRAGCAADARDDVIILADGTVAYHRRSADEPEKALLSKKLTISPMAVRRLLDRLERGGFFHLQPTAIWWSCGQSWGALAARDAGGRFHMISLSRGKCFGPRGSELRHQVARFVRVHADIDLEAPCNE